MKLARLDGSLAVNEDAPRGQGQQHLQASHTLNCGTWRGPAPEGGRARLGGAAQEGGGSSLTAPA